ncbi:MAG: polysaccharide biosynthesis tyrosine autokinase [Oscillochloridaceae bacterium]|nr:polysaccharide biosynthesis tyrosine autokinase [Chloroflexaceae bacterium]MDW8390710.1 polysaccharide biosynthesis tyrosine autokinase [Oscillochloridaceae bacterium]
MELKRYIDVLVRRRWIVILTALAACIAAILGTLGMEPRYKAATTVRITPGTSAPIDFGLLEYSVRLKNTYAELARSEPVLMATLSELGFEESYSVKSLRRHIRVKFPANNELMVIEVEDTNPNNAAALANTIANTLIEQSKSSPNRRNFTLTVVAPASVPTSPNVISQALLVAFGIASGLLGGVVLAFLMDNLDTRVYSNEQLLDFATNLPIGYIPAFSHRRNGGLESTAEGEALRLLRTRLLALKRKTPFKTILVASAEPRAGKTTIATGLAWSFAQQDRKVALVDGDMRLPRVHTMLGLKNEIGLGNVLSQQASLDEALQFSSRYGFHVLTSGEPGSNPAELLSSRTMAETLALLSERFDVVIIDTPALTAVPDAVILATLTDGYLLVVQRGHSRREDIQAAHEQLVAVGAEAFGVVINRAAPNRRYAYYQHR